MYSLYRVRFCRSPFPSQFQFEFVFWFPTRECNIKWPVQGYSTYKVSQCTLIEKIIWPFTRFEPDGFLSGESFRPTKSKYREWTVGPLNWIFLCPRMSHIITIISASHCIFRPIRRLKWLVVAGNFLIKSAN